MEANPVPVIAIRSVSAQAVWQSPRLSTIVARHAAKAAEPPMRECCPERPLARRGGCGAGNG